MRHLIHSTLILAAMASLAGAQAPEARIRVQAGQVLHPVSRYLTGACIEDVNHEVYGGIDSQMVFGENFQEPAPQPPLKGFTAHGGNWQALNGELAAAAGDGPKLLSDSAPFADGTARVDIFFADTRSGNAGLILRVTRPATGADRFAGYEISLEPGGRLVLGRHRQNWEPIRTAPCVVLINAWNTLEARLQGRMIEILVNGQSLIKHEETGPVLASGAAGLRTWQRDARFRNFSAGPAGRVVPLPFELAAKDSQSDRVSGMWRAVRRGTAAGRLTTEEQTPFIGRQSQSILFEGGQGEIGVENQGLNRWGLALVEGKPFEGCLWARAAQPAELFLALESRDGSRVYAEQSVRVTSNTWQRLAFTLAPSATDTAGRFALKLKAPGAVTAGYVLLQPGEWGRFKGLPVRKDVGEGLVDQGVTVLRQGGCMANAPEYRWKNMTGPRDRRPPYKGWWQPYSSHGWGIFEFLNFCEAAGFLGIPDVHMGEPPQDMADFIEYANGPATSAWGAKRAADGHPAPYQLKHLQLGNEEQVNDDYWQKFKPMAEAIWAKDPAIILVVGDFAYGEKFTDPFNFKGAAGRITTLAAHQKILQLARQHNREVWFDIHLGTEGPRPDWGGFFSYVDALERIAEGAKHRVVVFEFNAGNHAQRRALANALAINAIERDGRLPIATSANCLQPDGQNDNDWDQGLLFLNPSQVWLQPPGYVTRMISRHYQPLLVKSDVQIPGSVLDLTAKRSQDGRVLVLQIVNPGDDAQTAQLTLDGFVPSQPQARISELAAPLNARNTAANPKTVVPVERNWTHHLKDGPATLTLPPRSFTVIQFD